MEARGARREGPALRVAFWLARLAETPANFVLTAFLVFVGAALILLPFGTPESPLALSLIVFFTMYAELFIAGSVRFRAEYAIDLARRVVGYPQKVAKRPRGVNLLLLDYHFRALRRIGARLSGGHVDAFLALARQDLGWTADEDPSFWKVAHGIELALLEEAGRLAGAGLTEPFEKYAAALDVALRRDWITAEDWRRFLVGRFGLLSHEAKAVAAAYEPPSTLARLEAHVDILKFLAIVAALAAAVILGRLYVSL